MTKLKERYGRNALIAGGSEGIGAAFAKALAAEGMNLFLVGRRADQLSVVEKELAANYPVSVKLIQCDLADPSAPQIINQSLGDSEIDMLVYNAVQPYIGKFESADLNLHERIADVNVKGPLRLAYHFGLKMVERKRGAIILMSSLSGKQGSPYIATYAATKAFNLTLAEGLWYEWKQHNVDVIACIAGATSTPNFINSKPGKLGFFEPQVQTPEAVVKECLNALGKTPSVTTGSGNRLASFFMTKLLSRKQAIVAMGNSMRKIYKHLQLD